MTAVHNRVCMTILFAFGGALFGCKGQVAPGGGCSDNDACGTDFACLDGVCTKVCVTSEADCEPAQKCQSSYCVEVQNPACHAPSDCTLPPQCQTSVGAACVEGACRYARLSGASCALPNSASGTCVNGTCLPPGQNCSTNVDCSPRVCIGQECQVRSPVRGNCDVTPTPDDDDCTPPAVCWNGLCLLEDGADCTQNNACIHTCIGGHCSPLATTGQTCDQDDSEDCQSSLECAGTQCSAAAPCPGGNDDCAAYTMMSCIEGFCVTRHGTGRSCDPGDNADCTAGHTCTARLGGSVCLLSLGSTCTASSDCVSGLCDDSANQCRLPRDASCDSSDQCETGLSCGGSPKTCTSETACADGDDNDGDGNSDCDDSDCDGQTCNDGVACNGADLCGGGTCSIHATPCGETNCADGVDNDGDGPKDCADSDCNGQPCNDGVFCNGADRCSGGTCSLHDGDPCESTYSDGDCEGGCAEYEADCVATEPSGSPCDNGLYCDGTDSCDAGGGCTRHTGDPCAATYSDADCTGGCNESADSCNSSTSEPIGSACQDYDTSCNGTCAGSSCSFSLTQICTGNSSCNSCSPSECNPCCYMSTSTGCVAK